MKKIYFYSVRGDFGEFSSFAPYPITVNNIYYYTNECYFQSKKFVGSKYEFEIRKIKHPKTAAKRGRDRSLPLRKDWENVKDNVMLQAVLAKFYQHAKLQDLLLSTNDAILIEHTEKDSYWGDGGNGTGKNKLGLTLMKVRSVLADKNLLKDFIKKYSLVLK